MVESGKLSSGMHAIGNKNFGLTPSEYQEQNFLAYAQSILDNSIRPGGLYMPCALYKKDFVESGGYPEGNIYKSGIGTLVGNVIQSGDDYFFHNNQIMSRKKHITVFNSIVYHIQEGEKDENIKTKQRHKKSRRRISTTQ